MKDILKDKDLVTESNAFVAYVIKLKNKVIYIGWLIVIIVGLALMIITNLPLLFILLGQLLLMAILYTIANSLILSILKKHKQVLSAAFNEMEYMVNKIKEIRNNINTNLN